MKPSTHVSNYAQKANCCEPSGVELAAIIQ